MKLLVNLPRLLSAILLGVAAVTLVACSSSTNSVPAPNSNAKQIKHVFMIVLENKNYGDTFGTSTQDPYLQKTLVPQGTLLTQYFGTGHVSLDNYISMVSGQAPTPDTANDCIPGLSGTGKYINVATSGTTGDGQVVASGGCVYPNTVQTLPDQLVAKNRTWRGYMGDMGNDPAREAVTCGHPTLGGSDLTNSAEAPSASVPLGDAYATRHNPFMYFHSIIDSSSCNTNVVNLNQLNTDLQSATTTANYTFITPNLCEDGHDGDGTGTAGKGCANGQPGGLASADAFLKKWVPIIQASPAYRQDGMIVITFDEGNYTQSVASANGQTTVTLTFPGMTCCNQQPGPNLAGVRPSSATLVNTATLVEKIAINGYGGDRVGALLISPFVKAGGTSDTQYNHYSLLRSLEQIYGTDGYLGYANDPSLSTLGNDSAIFK